MSDWVHSRDLPRPTIPQRQKPVADRRKRRVDWDQIQGWKHRCHSAEQTQTGWTSAIAASY
ncbi:hypothetical protein F3J08_16685 [Asaia sp. As-1742]|nr:hypothetical protein [Asaia sp. As-1742]